ncbi:MAG: hypothetical protein ABJB16_05405, partial [Saprospiraceae bacterium]
MSLDGQVSVTATAGNMGPTPYTTLKDAFDAVNAGTHQGSITIVISGDTNESASAVLNGSGSGSSSYSSILIQPGGGAARTISGAIVAGSPLIDLNGADYITIDGLNTAGNSLIISNTTASAATGTSTIRFQTDATNNTITRCSILGSSNSTSGISGGNIWIGAAGITTGNDDNTISFCNIGPAGTNLPSKCIYLWGTSNSDPGTSNSGIVITNNNIFDFFSTSVVSTGIDINFGATGTLISNNKFYQTATRIQTGTAGNRAIRISNAQGNNYQIIGNTIGFANNMGTGKYTIDFQNSGSFNGISFSVGITTATSVQGNIIAGISISGGISGTFSTAPVVGIFHSAGLATIGDVTGNTIGSQSETSSITVTSSSSSAADVIGIGYFGIKDWTTDNNTIGGITASNTSTGAANIYGIVYLASNASWSCLNNIVGGSISNSIQSNTLSTGSRVQGIRASTTPSIISGNTIQNLSAAGGTGTTGADCVS